MDSSAGNHLEAYTDLDLLFREVYNSTNASWGVYRLLRPWSLACYIVSVKETHRGRLQPSEVLEPGSSVLDELRANCTGAYNSEVVPHLPIGSHGRILASLAFVSSLLDIWDNFPGPKPSRRHRVYLLLVPLWNKICQATMEPRQRELRRMRHFRWGIYNRLGMRSTSMRAAERRGEPLGLPEETPTLPHSEALHLRGATRGAESEGGSDAGGATSVPSQVELLEARETCL